MPSSTTVAAQTFGTLGAVCWSVQLLPQIWINYRRAHTHGLQPTMMLLWASAGIPLGIYNIVRLFPIALQIQPQILTVLSLITWAQTQYYPPQRDRKVRSKAWCFGVLGLLFAVSASIEVAIVFGLRAAVKGKTDTQVQYYPAVMVMGLLAALLLCAGVTAHYVDIWRERTVRGISFLFVGIDALGDLTSLISVVLWWKAGQKLDILGLAVYGSEFVLWLGVMGCGVWYNFRAWAKQQVKRRKLRGQDANGAVHASHGDAPRSSLNGNRRGSTGSGASHASGTVFRTASGRSVFAAAETADGIGEHNTSHDVFRLRSVVQV